MSRLFDYLLLIATIAASVFLFSRNTCCAIFPAAIGVCFVYFVSQGIMGQPRESRKSKHRLQLLCVTVVLSIAIAFVPPIRLTPAAAFQRAFNFPPPASLQVHAQQSRYEGGPGDSSTFFIVEGEKSALDNALKFVGAEIDDQLAEIWRHSKSWQEFLANRHLNIYWLDILSEQTAPTTPAFYRWRDDDKVFGGILIWDLDRQVGYVICSIG